MADLMTTDELARKEPPKTLNDAQKELADAWFWLETIARAWATIDDPLDAEKAMNELIAAKAKLKLAAARRNALL